MITVHFYTTLRLFLNTKEVKVQVTEEITILDLLKTVEEIIQKRTSKRFLWKLLDEENALKQGTIILINGRNILDTEGLDNRVSPADTVALFPPGGGG